METNIRDQLAEQRRLVVQQQKDCAAEARTLAHAHKELCAKAEADLDRRLREEQDLRQRLAAALEDERKNRLVERDPQKAKRTLQERMARREALAAELQRLREECKDVEVNVERVSKQIEVLVRNAKAAFFKKLAQIDAICDWKERPDKISAEVTIRHRDGVERKCVLPLKAAYASQEYLVKLEQHWRDCATTFAEVLPAETSARRKQPQQAFH